MFLPIVSIAFMRLILSWSAFGVSQTVYLLLLIVIQSSLFENSSHLVRKNLLFNSPYNIFSRHTLSYSFAQRTRTKWVVVSMVSEKKGIFSARSKIGKKKIKTWVYELRRFCKTSDNEDVFWQPNLKHTQSKSGLYLFSFIHLSINPYYIFNYVNTLNSKIYDLWLWSLADCTSFLKTYPYLLTIFSYYTSVLDPYSLIVPDHQCTELLLSVSLH